MPASKQNNGIFDLQKQLYSSTKLYINLYLKNKIFFYCIY